MADFRKTLLLLTEEYERGELTWDQFMDRCKLVVRIEAMHDKCQNQNQIQRRA
jgi:hypothetical protein